MPPEKPPASPLNQYVPALAFTTTVDADSNSFDAAAYKQALATMLGVDPQNIDVAVQSGSIIISIVVRFAREEDVEAAIQTITSKTLGDFGTDTGITTSDVSLPLSTIVEYPVPRPPPFPPPSPPPPVPPDAAGGVVPYPPPPPPPPPK